MASCALFASGFSILEQSVSGLGRGLAGMTASTDDPSALYFNPASAAWIERPTMVGGLHLLTGDVHVHDEGSTIPGHHSGDIIRQTEIPNFDFVYPIGDGLTLNVATSATSGTATNYHKDWSGRYFGIDTSIAVIEILPSVSYRLTDTVAVGVGVMFDYAKMKALQKIPAGAYFDPSNPYGHDAKIRSEGDDYAVGFSAGVVWMPFEGTKLGLAYRSSMEYTLDLDCKIYQIPEPLGTALGTGSSYKDHAKMKLKMPQNVNFGIQQAITEKLTLMLDIAWTDWSVMKEMTTKFEKGTLTGKTSTSVMNWHDSWRFSLGGEYKLTDKWTLRLGGTFDERAVTKHTNKVCELPDTHRYWVCVGASYQLTKQLRIDAAWNHLFFHPGHAQETLAEGQYTKGCYRGYTNLYSLGIKYEF